jgi:hypothetical protein
MHGLRNSFFFKVKDDCSHTRLLDAHHFSHFLCLDASEFRMKVYWRLLLHLQPWRLEGTPKFFEQCQSAGTFRGLPLSSI